MGFHRPDRRLAIPVRFDGVTIPGFSEGLAPVQVDESWSIIDRTGKVVIKLDVQRHNPKRRVAHVFAFSGGLANVLI